MKSIVQALVNNRQSNDPLRCWVPVCGTGGRAHELAILLSNACWSKGNHRQFKIFATDSDREALAQARSGPCLSGIVPGMPEGNGRVSHEGQAEIAKILRDHVIFSCHDLLTDPPFSKLNLICADNVFANLDEPSCQRISMMLHYVLKAEGYLSLGAAPSMPPLLLHWFEPTDYSSSCLRRRPDRKTSPSCFLTFKHRFDGQAEYHGQKRSGSYDVVAYDQLVSEHEELQTLSEQRQAANEEIEANNQELAAVNQELQLRTAQLGATLDQLEASERRYRSIVEDQSDFICRHSAAGTLTFVNSAFCKAHGVTQAECLGKTLPDMLPETSSWQATLTSLSPNRPAIMAEYRHTQPDGSPGWQQWNHRALFDERRQLIEYQSVGQDITERKALEADLARHRDNLEGLVVERTAEIERQKLIIEKALCKEQEISGLQRQFVSMVSHEFRTPLAIIDGAAWRIHRRFENLAPDHARDSLGKIRRSVSRLVELMESVLAAARLEDGKIRLKPSSCNLAEILDDLATSYSEVNPHRRIVSELDDLPQEVIADANLLRQVFSNLISNAIKYSPDGGGIWIDGRRAENGDAVISVRDEGLGIPKIELDNLFERFFRASTAVGIAGSGIGLHLAHQLVEMHGGKLEVDSELAVGTTFTVHLPLLTTAA
ncbi:MAG: ATP-binding protein [Geminicoccales bacterium]